MYYYSYLDYNQFYMITFINKYHKCNMLINVNIYGDFLQSIDTYININNILNNNILLQFYYKLYTII